MTEIKKGYHRKLRSFREEDLINNSLATLYQTWENAYSLIIEIELILEKTSRLLEHFHQNHHHPVSHSTDTLINILNNSSYQLRKTVGSVEYLMAEAYSLIDMDDNGLIFGKDFIFENNKDTSPYFKGVNIDPIVDYHPVKINLKKFTSLLPNIIFCPIEGKEVINITDKDFISIKEYLIEGESMTIPQVTEKEVIDNLIEEFNTGIDYNGDGLIFGKDFILLNAPSELMSLVPPFMPNIILSWNAFMMGENFRQVKPARNQQYYCDLLNQEYATQTDLDGNDLIYCQDFCISDDLDYLDPCDPYCVNKITWKQYFDGIRLKPDISYDNIEEFTVKLTTEFFNQEDIDNNDLIYGNGFLISDYDDAKTDCLWQVELYGSCTIIRDISKLTQIRNDYGFSPQMLVDYNQLEFDEYWKNINGITEPTLSDCQTQNKNGFVIQNGQIISCCIPIYKNKIKKYPMFIPILTWSDYLKL